MKTTKSITIDPKYLIEVEDLIESGQIGSFSRFAENAINKALEPYRDNQPKLA